MQKQSSSETLPNILNPTVPSDIGIRSQRQRIIDAMIASCAEKTYAETTISDVVRGASISRTTFYKRFPDKRACFDAARDHAVELVAAAASPFAQGDSPSTAVHGAAAAVLELLASRPELARLLAIEAVAVDPTIGGRYRALLIPAIEGLWEEELPRAGVSPGLAFGRAQLLVCSQIAAGRAADLPKLLPELVYLALAPFVGHDEALEQSRLASVDGKAQPVASP